MPHAWYSASFATGTEQAENTGTHGLKNKKSRRAESLPAGSTDLFSGGEGGIRTHVPHHWGNSISSRARYDRFDTSPCGQGTVFRFPLQKSAHV